MSLLLIVILLDISHLELVEDVLKETNFNDKDWKQLELQLRVQLGYISENSLNLKECLKEWLRQGTIYVGRDEFPTLDGLTVALDRIGYSKAGEYISKTCKLFNDQCY